jgi:hypothetical protein
LIPKQALSETYNSAAIARHAQGCRRRTHQDNTDEGSNDTNQLMLRRAPLKQTIAWLGWPEFYGEFQPSIDEIFVAFCCALP